MFPVYPLARRFPGGRCDGFHHGAGSRHSEHARHGILLRPLDLLVSEAPLGQEILPPQQNGPPPCTGPTHFPLQPFPLIAPTRLLASLQSPHEGERGGGEARVLGRCPSADGSYPRGARHRVGALHGQRFWSGGLQSALQWRFEAPHWGGKPKFEWGGKQAIGGLVPDGVPWRGPAIAFDEGWVMEGMGCIDSPNCLEY